MISKEVTCTRSASGDLCLPSVVEDTEQFMETALVSHDFSALGCW